jgi:hypothetical protein
MSLNLALNSIAKAGRGLPDNTVCHSTNKLVFDLVGEEEYQRLVDPDASPSDSDEFDPDRIDKWILVNSIRVGFYKRRPEIEALIREGDMKVVLLKYNGEGPSFMLICLQDMFATTSELCLCVLKLRHHLHQKFRKDLPGTWLLDERLSDERPDDFVHCWEVRFNNVVECFMDIAKSNGMTVENSKLTGIILNISMTMSLVIHTTLCRHHRSNV